MSMKYTAKEMRELADMIDHGGAFALTDPAILAANVAMLRRAADALEHEKEREYSIQVFCGKWEFVKHLPTDMTLDDAVIFVYELRQRSDMTYRIVRRDVGEWEVIENV